MPLFVLENIVPTCSFQRREKPAGNPLCGPNVVGRTAAAIHMSLFLCTVSPIQALRTRSFPCPVAGHHLGLLKERKIFARRGFNHKKIHPLLYEQTPANEHRVRNAHSTTRRAQSRKAPAPAKDFLRTCTVVDSVEDPVEAAVIAIRKVPWASTIIPSMKFTIMDQDHELNNLRNPATALNTCLLDSALEEICNLLTGLLIAVLLRLAAEYHLPSRIPALGPKKENHTPHHADCVDGAWLLLHNLR